MSGTVAVPLPPPPRARLRSAVRLAVCAAVPWFLCLWWGTSTVPVPAALPAVLILRDDVYDAPRRGWERLLGVVVGVALTTLVLHWLPPPTASSVATLSAAASASFLAVLACGCAGMYLMYQGGAPNQQVLVSALVIYATALPGYALARLVESAVGIATVILLGPLLWPPDPYRTAATGLGTYRGELDDLLGTVAARLGAGGPRAVPRFPEDAELWRRPRSGLAAYERAARRTRLPRLYLRTPTRPPDGLEERLRLAARTALTLQYFTEELRERARTDGPDGPPVTPVPDPALRDLAPLVRATARALDAALRGADCAADLDRARELDLAHRAAHPTRHDAVLRAGLHLTHEAVAAHLSARR
ncbi:FUSC family protein [Streptomyces virginiae]|uniref:FUSC family protein n=1 Tax=Streptomyces virginiae TaxID=1961 RepID=UPI0035D81403